LYGKECGSLAADKPLAGSHLAINTLTRKLYYYKGDRLVKEFPVAVGKPSTPTPPGNYKVKNKILNPGGVLGTRWMGLTIPGGNYGIHGNNNPSSIGQAASMGCVRMYNNHVEELFPLIPIGTPVYIYGRSATDAIPVYKPGKVGGSFGDSGEKAYTVQSGDTLWEIAQAHNITLKALLAANSIANPNVIAVGQTIIIP